GAIAPAERQLRALLDVHATAGNPLTLGALYEALAELAVLRNDEPAFAVCVEEVGRYFRGSRDPALVARHERLARAAAAFEAAPGHDTTFVRPVNSRPPRLATVVHLLQHGGEHTLTGSAQWALKQLTDLTEADTAFLFVPRGESVECVARIGELDSTADIERFVSETLAALARERDDDDAGNETIVTEALADVMRLEAHGKVFQMSLLRAPTQPAANDNSQIIGAVVLSGGTSAPAGVLKAMGERLAASRAEYASL
ncbi:MAG: hypothetical protein RL701_1179, partial [Pseudomonadota bacterium]